MQGDYIYKHQNAETKGSQSCLKVGFIKNTKIFNSWIWIAVDMKALLNTFQNISGEECYT